MRKIVYFFLFEALVSVKYLNAEFFQVEVLGNRYIFEVKQTADFYLFPIMAFAELLDGTVKEGALGEYWIAEGKNGERAYFGKDTFKAVVAKEIVTLPVPIEIDSGGPLVPWVLLKKIITIWGFNVNYDKSKRMLIVSYPKPIDIKIEYFRVGESFIFEIFLPGGTEFSVDKKGQTITLSLPTALSKITGIPKSTFFDIKQGARTVSIMFDNEFLVDYYTKKIPPQVVVEVVKGSYVDKSVLLKNDNLSLPVVVVDPAHGGGDSGVVLNSLQEKELNLIVSSYLSELVKDEINLYLTRSDDSYLEDLERVSFVNNKRADLSVSVHVIPVTERGKVVVIFPYGKKYSEKNLSLNGFSLWKVAHINSYSESSKLANIFAKIFEDRLPVKIYSFLTPFNFGNLSASVDLYIYYKVSDKAIDLYYIAKLISNGIYEAAEKR